MEMTPKPSFRVHSGNVPMESALPLARAARGFLHTGLSNVWVGEMILSAFYAEFVDVEKERIYSARSPTVELRSMPAPVVEAFTPPPESIRLGRYLDTTTRMSSSCSLTTHTYGGMPLAVRMMAPMVPCGGSFLNPRPAAFH